MSTIKIEGSKLWVSIEQLATNAQRKIAAVAYVSDDSRIKFGQGDILIVDASDKQIASGTTSARVLGDAINRGAKVYSLSNLHAKLMVFDDTVVSCSANISDSSATTLKEVGVISSSPQLTKEALAIFDRLKRDAQRIDKPFIKRISKIKIRDPNWGTQTAKRPTLLEAFQMGSPCLDDFVFMIIEGQATLTNRRIRKAAKKKQVELPPSDRWHWVEFDSDKYPDELFHKLFVEQGLKILSLVVESTDTSIQRIDELSPYSLIYVNHIQIDKQIAFNCIMDKRTPFKMGATQSTKPFCAALNRALEANPKLGRKLFKSKDWVFKAKDITKALQEEQ